MRSHLRPEERSGSWIWGSIFLESGTKCKVYVGGVLVERIWIGSCGVVNMASIVVWRSEMFTLDRLRTITPLSGRPQLQPRPSHQPILKILVTRARSKTRVKGYADEICLLCRHQFQAPALQSLCRGR